MSNPFNGPISRLWVRWKSLNLPWRKQRLAGWDLNGNTFWEFKDTVRSNRWRRIARQPRTIDYADIQISPQWHQWLRHTRPDAPTLAEQQADVQRRVQIQELAQLADARWAKQQSYLNAPQSPFSGHVAPAAERAASEGAAGAGTGAVIREAPEGPSGWEKQRQVRDPWQAGGEKWQPDAWSPQGKAK